MAPPRATTVIDGLCSHSRDPGLTGTQSPETRTSRKPAKAPGAAASQTIEAWAGAEFQRVTPWVDTRSAHTLGSV